MATEEALQKISGDAGADLTTKQYTFVKFDSSGDIVNQDATREAVAMVLQNDPNTGQEASVAFGGVSKVLAGATIVPGQQVTSDADGAAVPAGSPADISFGTCKLGGASGEIISVLIQLGDAT